jgi:hypothetical protein
MMRYKNRHLTRRAADGANARDSGRDLQIFVE